MSFEKNHIYTFRKLRKKCKEQKYFALVLSFELNTNKLIYLTFFFRNEIKTFYKIIVRNFVSATRENTCVT